MALLQMNDIAYLKAISYVGVSCRCSYVLLLIEKLLPSKG